jgi:DNA primase
MAGRWHCFACQAGGDAIAFAEAYSQVGFREAVRLVEADGPLPRGSDPHLHLRPANPTAGGGLVWDASVGSDREPPDVARTPSTRLYDAVAVAWRYYTPDGLAAMARRYLAGRSIDVAALEARECRPLAGHTPKSRTGLVEHLRRHGFADDEAVDAGLATRRPDGQVEDFFTHRMVLPVRNDRDRVVGLIGRDVSGGLRAKYLNTPTTAIYDKSRHLYRPSRPTRSSARAVVVEGAIDALAIDAAAVQAHLDVAAVSPSGTAFTAEHRAQVTAWSSSPPVLCGDGDGAGRAATCRWVTEMTLEGREAFALSLPDTFDPADWLMARALGGLRAFVVADNPGSEVDAIRPVHAGRYLAAQLARQHPLAASLEAIARAGSHFGSTPARGRFLREAVAGFAEAGLGPDGWLGRQLANVVATSSLPPKAALASQYHEGGIAI